MLWLPKYHFIVSASEITKLGLRPDAASICREGLLAPVPLNLPSVSFEVWTSNWLSRTVSEVIPIPTFPINLPSPNEPVEVAEPLMFPSIMKLPELSITAFSLLFILKDISLLVAAFIKVFPLFCANIE